jgi:M6 family metalloprotease-like protein
MKKNLILALVALLAGYQFMTAIPAYPGKIVYIQPDGTRIVIQRHGDEFGHWTTDGSGRLVVESPDGFYRPDTGVSVDQILRNAANRRAVARQKQAARRASSQHIALGKKHFLVILVEFSNKQFSTSDDPHAAFDALLNQHGYSVNGGTGSARDYYSDNSHGLFEPVFDVYGPVQLDTTYAYYGQNDAQGEDRHPEEAIIDACKKLDGEIDFTQYDNDGDGYVDLVFMYYAGKGEADGGASNTIWPHQWELTSAGKILKLDGKQIDSYACTNEVVGSGALYGKMCGIGTACHEFAHAMGLPDFYDTDYAINGQAAGLFFFSMMDSGAYNNEGRTPPFLNIVERITLGWLQEEDVLRDIPEAGTYTLPSVDENVAYRTLTDMDGEYFVYECRGSNGWDAGLYSHGLVVYHVDKSDRSVKLSYGSSTARRLWENWKATNSINENGSHPCFYIIPSADPDNLLYGHYMYSGNYYFDYDKSGGIPFPGSEKVTVFTPKSWNGVESEMSFRNIAYSNNQVTLTAFAPYDGLDYCTIADAGSYKAGDRFTFALVCPEEIEAPVSVVWYYDDEPAGADSVTLAAGPHTVDARLTYADGRQAVLTLEINVQ